MVPFHLQLELKARQVTIAVEQLDQLADEAGFMRYQVKTFNDNAVVYVNIENDQQLPPPAHGAEYIFETSDYPEQNIGYSLDDVFPAEEVTAIAKGIREYHSSRQLNFDQIHFDF